MTKEAKAFIMGLLTAGVVFSTTSKIPNKNINKESNKNEITIQNEIENNNIVDIAEEELLPIREHIDELTVLQDGLYDYIQFIHEYYYEEYKDEKIVSKHWIKYENTISEDANNKLKYYGYKEEQDENGNIIQVKDKEADSMEELIKDGYKYIRSSLGVKYYNEETVVSHLFIGYKKVIRDNGKIEIVKSEPTFSIESLLSQGYDYVKPGEIYYSFDKKTGRFIEYQDIPGPLMVEQKKIILL